MFARCGAAQSKAAQSKAAPSWAARAAVLCLVVALGAAPAAAVTQSGAVSAHADTNVAADTGPAMTVALTSVGPSVLTTSDSLTVAATVSAGVTPLTGVEVVASITDARLTSTDEVDAFMEDPSAAQRREIARQSPHASNSASTSPPGAVPANESATATLSIPSTTLALPLDSWGVYGVAITATVAGQEPSTQAFVITWMDARVPTMDVAVVATISGTPERASALLTAASDPRVTLVVDPAATTGVDPALTRLVGREVYALPAGNLDIASASHAMAGGLIDFAVSRSAAIARSAPMSSENVPWIAVTAHVDATVGASASASGAFAMLAGPWTVSAPETTAAVMDTTVAGERAVPLITADARLSGVLTRIPPSSAAGAARIVAESALRAEAGIPVTVVAPGDFWVVDGSRSSLAVRALLDAPWVRPVSLAGVLSGEGREAVELPDASSFDGDVPIADVVEAAQVAGRVAALSRASAQPSALLDGPGLELLTAMALPARADPISRAKAIDHALEDGRKAAAAVAVTSGSQLTLVSSSGNVPITVRNDLTTDVTVVLVMQSRSPNLVIKGQPTATIPAGGQQTVLVPVTAVSSDNVNVTVVLRSEAGDTLAVAQTLRVRVRAQWGNTATALFTVMLVVLMVAGIVRTIRRGRKETRLRPETEAQVAGAEPLVD